MADDVRRQFLEIVQECPFSIHDLSRIEIVRTPHPTPRFNMPCELGTVEFVSRSMAS